MESNNKQPTEVNEERKQPTQGSEEAEQPTIVVNSPEETDEETERRANYEEIPPTMEDLASETEPDAKSWTESLIESLDQKAVAAMPVEKDSEKYNMRHPKRGKAVIFNHMKFSNGQPARHGTDRDEHNLQVCLSSVGFEVIVYRDLQRLKIFEVIENLRKEDHSNEDCLMIIVLSHGEQDKIFSEDSDYRPEELWNPFTADRCPTLAGKPKIVLIQACRGDRLDSGTMLMGGRTQVDSFSKKKDKNYVVPNRADFLVVYSTVAGYYSWRNTSEGSWFIQSVVSAIMAYKDQKDLLSIMTIVARQVALNFESNVPTSETFDQKKQVPMISSTLLRDVHL